MIHVITFATHAEGNFNNMINNSYGIKIKVLGWGKKWTGFKMKYIYVYNYIKKLNDDDIIIFLDGFDVNINGYLEDALKIFKKNNYKVLFSKQNNNNFFDFFFLKKVFNPYNEKYILNTGLYMGYVKYLKILLDESLKLKCNDDQRNMNILKNKYNFINIDINNEIFENISKSYFNKLDSIFIQTPGNGSINRIKRGIFEYSQFFIKQISVLLIIIFSIIIFNKKINNKIKLIIILLIIFFFINFYKKIDKSCI
jgi:hypothetical protein